MWLLPPLPCQPSHPFLQFLSCDSFTCGSFVCMKRTAFKCWHAAPVVIVSEGYCSSRCTAACCWTRTPLPVSSLSYQGLEPDCCRNTAGCWLLWAGLPGHLAGQDSGCQGGPGRRWTVVPAWSAFPASLPCCCVQREAPRCTVWTPVNKYVSQRFRHH